MANTFVDKAAGSIAVARQYEIPCELMELNGSIERLEKVTHALTEQLSSALRVAPETAEKHPGVPVPVLCPLADNIREMRARIDRLYYALDSLHSRIEL
jgi:hypothetical protein